MQQSIRHHVYTAITTGGAGIEHLAAAGKSAPACRTKTKSSFRSVVGPKRDKGGSIFDKKKKLRGLAVVIGSRDAPEAFLIMIYPCRSPLNAFRVKFFLAVHLK